MNSLKKLALFLSLALLLAGVSATSLSAGACTYREVIMALEQGNTVRGMALMRMAHRDGDGRASQFLAKKDVPLDLPVVMTSRQEASLLGLHQNNPD